MEITSSIGVNLLSSLLWLVVGAAIYRLVITPLQQRRTVLSRLLRFRSSEGVTICYGIIPPHRGSVYYTVAEGDLAAINHAYSALAASFGYNRVRAVSHQTAHGNLSGLPNVVSVSGPKWNRVTEILLGRLGSPVTFNQTEELVIQRPGEPEKRFSTIRRPNGEEQTCYGLVCGGSIETSTGERRRVVICAGLNTISTYGAVVFLAKLGKLYSLRHYRDLSPRKVGNRWAIILQVENLSNPKARAFLRAPLDPNSIATSVVTIIGEKHFHDPFVYHF